MDKVKLHRLIKNTSIEALKEAASLLGGGSPSDVATVLDVHAPIEDRGAALIRCWSPSVADADADTVGVSHPHAMPAEVRP